MTFGSTFGRVFSPTFQPKSTAAAASGWWLAGGIAAANCIAAYQPKGAASLAASYVNLANPGTYDATEGTAPTFDTSIGWTFSAASNQYLRTGVTPENDQTWSMIARFSGHTTNGQAMCGSIALNGAVGFRMFPRRGVANNMVWNNGTQIASGERQSEGIMAIAGANAFFDGTSYGTTGGWSGATPIETYIGAQNFGGSPDRYYTGVIEALAIYDVDITSYIASLGAAINLL